MCQLLTEELRRKVRSVFPRKSIIADRKTTEKLRFPERLENRAIKFVGQVQLT